MRNTNSNTLILILSILLTSFSSFGQINKNSSAPEEKGIKLRGVAELGFVGVFDHKVQFSNDGTYFDYRKDGGQDVLFPVSRFSVELDFNQRNTLVFLYQPLRLQSQVLLEDDLIVDGLTFKEGTSVKLLYNFPFYRLSYLRELLPQSRRYSLAIGGSLQIRNATISFESADGSQFRSNRDIGFVPAFKLRSRAHINRLLYLELEADGIYAPVSYLNGSDNEVVGAILDASLRSVINLSSDVKTFFNLRYLGGGAVGTSDDDEGPGDGYVRNWLHFYTVSLGVAYEF